jgi:glucose uptake protein
VDRSDGSAGSDGTPGPAVPATSDGAVLTQPAPAAAPTRATRAPVAVGLLGAVGAGVLWGSYFVPVQRTGVPLWAANLPLAAGMLVGGALLAAPQRHALRLAHRSGYLVLPLAGALWGAGNIGMLLLVERIGTGRGFTVAQLSLVVNALVGILIFNDPPLRSRATATTSGGIVLAVLGAVLLGQLK